MKRLFAYCAVLFVFIAQPVLAADFEEGLHYFQIEPIPAQRSSGDNVEVVEFFWYGCPHCNQLEPYMKSWLQKKPDNVEFKRIPVMFGGAANLHAQAYYSLQLMGESERLHDAWFAAMNNEKRRLRTQEELEEFLKEQNVDLDKFRAAMNSFAVQTRVKRASVLMNRYGVRSVPSLVVDGRYRSGSGFDNGYQGLTDVTDYLIEKVRQQRMSTSGG